ncbi:hypothetical protein As57867_004464, partial [Aphanomyces stellatus]
MVQQHTVNIESPVPGADFHQAAAKPSQPRRFRFLGGLAALCGVACVAVGAVVVSAQHKQQTTSIAVASALQEASAIKLSLHFKRASMFYHGQDTADIYVFPRGASASTSDVLALGFDGVLSLAHNGTTEKYIYANDRGYYVQSQLDGSVTQASCLQASQLPAFTTIQSALASASVIDQAQIGTVALTTATACPKGILHRTLFGGETFVACLTANQITKVYGSDMDIEVTYLASVDAGVPSLTVPTTSTSGVLLNCPAIPAQADSVAPVTSLAEKVALVKDTVLGTRTESLFGPSCKCKNKPKPCLMVHGVSNPIAGGLTDTFPFYWGNVDQHLPCCSSVKFV